MAVRPDSATHLPDVVVPDPAVPMPPRTTKPSPQPQAIDIPFNRPATLGREYANVADAVAKGHISGDGAYTQRCQALLEEALGSPRVLLTTSCTHALEMSALLLNLQPGDEVIVPSYTFVTSATAYALRGAKLVFADVRPDTMNLDETLLPKLITQRTKAVVCVHYGGVACAMDEIVSTCKNKGITLIEDNAHGLFATYQGKPLGTFGDLATLSFHETKNFSCGEGGALILNRPDLIERAEIIRSKGTNRQAFLRGEVDKYTWCDHGSSYPPSDLLAAFLLAQLDARETITTRRAQLWHRYNDALRDWCRAHGVRTQAVPSECSPSHHLFALVFQSVSERGAFIDHLRSRGILAVFHYQPLHRSPMGVQLGGGEAHCPVTDALGEGLVRLPMFNTMSEAEQGRVIDAVLEFVPGAADA